MLAEQRPSVALERNASLDGARARELYKYFRPPAADGELPDTVLTAHAQLVAWRLNAERSMITLIDVETQYFVAESTKTLHLDGTSKHDHPDDAIWAGVRVLTKINHDSRAYLPLSVSVCPWLGDYANTRSQRCRRRTAGQRALRCSTSPKTIVSASWIL